jgi:hypothetical protein
LRRLFLTAAVTAAVLFGATLNPTAAAADPIIFGCDSGVGYMTTSTPVVVAQGATAVFHIDINRDGGCTGALYLDLRNAPPPAGSTATISPYPATGNTATLTVTTSNKIPTVTPVGTYTFTVYPHTASSFPPDTTLYLAPSVEVVASIAPIVSGPRATLGSSTIGATTSPVKISWSATDPNGIASYRVHRQTNGGGWSNVTLASATATSITQALTFNNTYRYRVTAIDKQGHASGWAYLKTFKVRIIQQSSSLVKSAMTWHTATNASASGGSYKYLTFGPSDFNITVTAASVGWVSIKGPTRSNNIGVYLDGAWYKDVSATASSVSYRRIVFALNMASNVTRNYRFFNLGTQGTDRIDNDALVLLVQQ